MILWKYFSEYRQAGFDGYFTKPIGIEALNKAAEEAFEKIDMWNIAEE